MAYGISLEENLDSMDVKNKMVKNINQLSQNKAEFLVASMSILIDKSINDGETITDQNTKREFISFLISLYY
jgi:hypothetical protein